MEDEIKYLVTARNDLEKKKKAFENQVMELQARVTEDNSRLSELQAVNSKLQVIKQLFYKLQVIKQLFHKLQVIKQLFHKLQNYNILLSNLTIRRTNHIVNGVMYCTGLSKHILYVKTFLHQVITMLVTSCQYCVMSCICSHLLLPFTHTHTEIFLEYCTAGSVGVALKSPVWQLVLALPRLNLSNVFIYFYVFRIVWNNLHSVNF